MTKALAKLIDRVLIGRRYLLANMASLNQWKMEGLEARLYSMIPSPQYGTLSVNVVPDSDSDTRVLHYARSK